MDDYFRAAVAPVGAGLAPRLPTVGDAAAAFERAQAARKGAGSAATRKEPRKRFRRRGPGILGSDTELRRRLNAVMWTQADPNVVLSVEPESRGAVFPADDMIAMRRSTKDAVTGALIPTGPGEPLFTGGPGPGLPPMLDDTTLRHQSKLNYAMPTGNDPLQVQSEVLGRLPEKAYNRGPVDELVLTFLGDLSPTKNLQFLTQVELIPETESPKGFDIASRFPWLSKFASPSIEDGGLTIVLDSGGNRVVVASNARSSYMDSPEAPKHGVVATLRRKLPPTSSPTKIVRRYARKRSMQFPKTENFEEEDAMDDEQAPSIPREPSARIARRAARAQTEISEALVGADAVDPELAAREAALAAAKVTKVPSATDPSPATNTVLTSVAPMPAFVAIADKDTDKRRTTDHTLLSKTLEAAARVAEGTTARSRNATVDKEKASEKRELESSKDSKDGKPSKKAKQNATDESGFDNLLRAAKVAEEATPRQTRSSRARTARKPTGETEDDASSVE